MTTTATPSINVIMPIGTAVGPWPTGWTYADPSDVWIYIETDGVAGPDLIEGPDYTLMASNPQVNGGQVALTGPTVPVGGWTNKHRLIIRRWTARNQGIALPDTEGHKPRATERGLDRAMRIAEELSDDLDLTVKVAPGETPPTPAEIKALAGGIEGIFDEAVAQGAAAGAAASEDRLLKDGANADPSLAAAIPFKLEAAGAAQQSVAEALSAAPLSASQFGGTDRQRLQRASVAGGEKGRAVNIPSRRQYVIDAQLPIQTTWICDGPIVLTAVAPTPYGILPGRLFHLSGVADDTGAGPAYASNPIYLGSYSKAANRQYKAVTGRGDPLGEASLAVMSEWGHAGALFYSRSSDSTTPGFGTMAVFAYAMNDTADGTKAAAAAYLESIRLPGAGYTPVVEGDAINFGSVVQLNPYNIYANGSTGIIWGASGGETTAPTNPASFAYAVVHNGSPFSAGIVAGANALSGTDGITGSGVFLSMARGHRMVWHTPSGADGASIYSYVNTYALRPGIVFVDYATQFTQNGKLVASLEGNDPDNYISLKASAFHEPLMIVAHGLNPATDIEIVPGPTGGRLMLGYASVAGSVTPNSYIEIKNGNGETLRLACQNMGVN